MSDPRSPQSRIGIFEFLSWDHPWNGRHNGGECLDRSVAALQEAGAEIARFDFLWSDIEPESGRYDFARYDRIVEVLTSREIKALGILAYSPAWCRRDWREAPDARLYARFARAVLHRYKDRIRHWEIWHEPDNAAFWVPQDRMRTYVEVLKRVYGEMKDEDSTSRVHLGGLSKALPSALTDFYEQGGGPFFDAVQIHAFANPLAPDALDGLASLYEEVRQIMASHGDGRKPVWLTQIGCPGMQRRREAPPWWLGRNLTEDEQARWLTQAMSKALTWPGVEMIFWSYLRDTHRHFNSGGDYFGLLRQDFSKKPSFLAFQKLVSAEKSSLSKAAL